MRTSAASTFGAWMTPTSSPAAAKPTTTATRIIASPAKKLYVASSALRMRFISIALLPPLPEGRGGSSAPPFWYSPGTLQVLSRYSPGILLVLSRYSCLPDLEHRCRGLAITQVTTSGVPNAGDSERQAPGFAWEPGVSSAPLVR